MNNVSTKEGANFTESVIFNRPKQADLKVGSGDQKSFGNKKRKRSSASQSGSGGRRRASKRRFDDRLEEVAGEKENPQSSG